MTGKNKILKIIEGNNLKSKRALFSFDSNDTNENILLKFKLWVTYFRPNYFKFDDAKFHNEMDKYNLKCYREPFTFINIGYRGCAKTLRTKIFIAYVIANDLDHRRKYFKILSHELDNSCQITTDIYNLYVSPKFREIYPDIFEKTDAKEEKRMSGFKINSFGVKILASTVGKQQRGGLQDESRPDVIFFDDFEDVKTLRSAVVTKAIGDTMEEARQSLPTDGSGSCIYCCNYISEAGNVHKLVNIGETPYRKIMITPILDKENNPTWPAVHTPEILEAMRENDKDFEGEKMCLEQDTLIKTSIGFKKIKEIKIGDLVLTHKGNFKKVLNIFKSFSGELLDITVNSKKTTITKNHPILLKQNNVAVWENAGNLKINDLIIYE